MKPASIDEHDELPFGSFDEFKKACVQKRCYVAVNSAVIDEWFFGQWNAQIPFRFYPFVLCNLGLFITASIFLFGLVSKQWLILSILPLSLLLMVALSPRSAKPNRVGRLLVLFFLLSGFIWAVTAFDTERAIISGGLLFVWVVQRLVFFNRSKMFFAHLLRDEQFCSTIWRRAAFAVRMTDEANNVDSNNFDDQTAFSACDIEVTATYNDKDIKISIETTHNSPSDGAGTTERELDSEVVRKIELRAMKVVMQYEFEQGRKAKDVSMYYVGYDVESCCANSNARAIEVKGKVSSGAVLLTPNEWKTARRLGDRYFLYVVENVWSSTPTIKIIQNPHEKLQPSIRGVQYQLKRGIYKSKANAIELAKSKS